MGQRQNQREEIAAKNGIEVLHMLEEWWKRTCDQVGRNLQARIDEIRKEIPILTVFVADLHVVAAIDAQNMVNFYEEKVNFLVGTMASQREVKSVSQCCDDSNDVIREKKETNCAEMQFSMAALTMIIKGKEYYEEQLKLLDE